MSAVQYRKASIALAAFAVAAGAALVLPGAASAAPQQQVFQVDASTPGLTSTGFTLEEGVAYTFTTTGEATSNAPGGVFGDADGSENLCYAEIECQVDGAPFAGLVAQVGDAPATFVGASGTLTGTGLLSFGFNDGAASFNDNAGGFTVTVSYDDGIDPVDPDPGCTGSACFDFMDFFGSSAA